MEYFLSARKRAGILVLVGLCMATACGGSALPPQGTEGLRIVVANAPTTNEMGRYILAGLPMESGDAYALLANDGGDVDVVYVAWEDSGDCDGCPEPRYWVDYREWVVIADHAIGPISGDVSRMSATNVEYSMSDFIQGTGEAVSVRVDVDGDGSPDLEQVLRCGERVSSGCDDTVCAEICRFTRHVGSRQERGLFCESFIPDVEDCLRDVSASDASP